MNKYTLTSNTKVVDDVTLYQIQALRDFAYTKAGDLGGYVETESNLDQQGVCWVSGNAYAYGNAHVFGNARVFDNARVYGNAQVFDNACVYGSACVPGNAHILGNARASGSAYAYGNARVYGNAQVSGNAHISGCAQVSGNAQVYDNARVFDQMSIVFGSCNVDLANIRDSIRCQTGLAVVNDVVLCYKRVRKDLSSIYDRNFKYVVGEVAEDAEPEISNASCALGLHFSHATYWDRNVCLQETVLLLCEVHIDDVITCQEGKIRAKKCKVLGAC